MTDSTRGPIHRPEVDAIDRSGAVRPRHGFAAFLGLLVVLVPGFDSRASAPTSPPPPLGIQLTLVRPEQAGVTRERPSGADAEPIVPPADLAFDDLVQTDVAAKAEIRFDGRFLVLDEQSALVLRGTHAQPVIEVISGRFWYRSSLGPQTVVVTNRAGVRLEFLGTEFALDLRPDAGESDPRLSITMIDGQARLHSPAGVSDLGPLQRGAFGGRGWEVVDVAPGDARRAAVLVNRELQWALYYPAILDPDELPSSLGTNPALAESLAAYRRGHLLAAYAAHPRAEAPGPAEHLYHAALLIGVGRIEAAEALLDLVPKSSDSNREPSPSDPGALAQALRVLVTAVRGGEVDRSREPRLASEWLAESYYQQSRAGQPTDPSPPAWEFDVYGTADEPLRRALTASRRALAAASDRGPETPALALAREAELLFGFGDLRAAERQLDRALAAAPENAQALALRGFLLAARDSLDPAIVAFDTALAIDPGLGNAWLGRGLARFRRGDTAGALSDLERAVAVEPNRAFFRSYLAKGYHEAADSLARVWSAGRRALAESLPEAAPKGKITALLDKAGAELVIADRLDPGDPTAPLYSALLNQRRNRINDAIADLERSMDLNDRRAVYRSSLLLDEDRAVRGANLAAIYRDAGLEDVGLREATRAVTADYGNPSAHLFLANGYQDLRDPAQITLRYETPWLNELLIAQVLQPVGAGSLSQSVSQQEYSRLFRQDGLRAFSRTEYRDNGDWVESFSQYGTLGRTDYSLDAFYLDRNGQRPNDDLTTLTLWGKVKQEIGPDDTVLVQAIYYDADGGDNRQLYDPAEARPAVRVDERQEPVLLGSWNHRWNEEHRTLFLGGWTDSTVAVTDSAQPNLLTFRNTNGVIVASGPQFFDADLDYESRLDLVTTELQHLWQLDRFATIVGLRYQHAWLDTVSPLVDPVGLRRRNIDSSNLEIPTVVESTFDRWSAYAYEHWEAIPDHLVLVGGLAYDRVEYPVNHRYTPVASVEDVRDQVSPKAGFILAPDRFTTLRAGYSRSLGGLGFDQSFRLEPTQVAGFIQSYRSLVPESVVGSVPVPDFETLGAMLDRRFPTGTYLAVGGEWLSSGADVARGSYEAILERPFQPFPIPLVSTGYREAIDYEERSLIVTAHQLIGRSWSVGLRYRLGESEMDREPDHPQLPATHVSSTLHSLDGFVLWNSPGGLFSELQVPWRSQSNRGDDPDRPGDTFAQVHAFVGYRLLQRRAEIRFGLLNLTDRDYRLNPLSWYAELPRERTFYASLKLEF